MLSILCHLHSRLPCTVERREGSRFGVALVIFRAVPLWNYLLTVNSDFCGKKITKPAAYSSGIFPGHGQKSRVMKQTICSIQKTFLISAYFFLPLTRARCSDEDITANTSAPGLVGVEHASVRQFMSLLLARFPFL